MLQERLLNLPESWKKSGVSATLNPFSLGDLRNFGSKGMHKNTEMHEDWKHTYQDLLIDPQLQVGTSCANISSRKQQKDSENAKTALEWSH